MRPVNPLVDSARDVPSGGCTNWIVWCIFSTSVVMPSVASKASRAAPRRSETLVRVIVLMCASWVSR